jgi:DNA-directed RNA polymerase specialized sigma24 family protein
MSAPSTDRLQQLAKLYAKHDAQLLSLVRRRVAAQPATAADACSYAWAQLLAAEHIDLTVPWGPLAWLTTTAVREAWRLNALEWRTTPLCHDDLATIAKSDSTAPSTDDLAELHDRLDLIDQLPERPRRFLLRQAIGYSYDEIAAAEHATYTTTSRLITDARRKLRELDRARGANNGR